jgi:hypothetical protein
MAGDIRIQLNKLQAYHAALALLLFEIGTKS